ncbi:hypothetical protein NF681_11265 [Comamonadaceae bacterium OTU4NAUVB1]|nr:hypothetical protein NF681_11265 [Comamonadaceae bacterium OTU4NAUVB1]
MDFDFQPTVSLVEHRTSAAPAPSSESGPSFFTVLVVFIVGLLIVIPSLAWLVRHLVRS